MPCALIAYDANGNTLSDAQGRSFTWDFENRLTQVVNPGVGTTTFRYDPFGRRIQKSGPLGTTNYLYDGMNIAEEMDSAGSIVAKYTQGQEIDEPLAMVRSDATDYFQADGLGSITSFTTPSGVTAATYSYDAFGNVSSSTGSITNPFRYTGREFDPETGAYYYRARYYDALYGRFVSEDPTEFNGGNNFYSYAANAPTYFLDPLGLEPNQCCATKGKLPGTNVPYRMDMRQQPRPNMHVYWPDGTETIVNSNGGWDLTHGGKPLAKPPMCYRPSLRTVVNSFLERVNNMMGDAMAVVNLLTLPLEEYNARKELEDKAKNNHRTPMQEFCSESHDAGDPDFYLSPVGPLPNPCKRGVQYDF